MKACKLALASLLLWGMPWMAFADVLVLQDGQAITGKFQGGDTTAVSFLVNGQVRKYYLSEINSITIVPGGNQSSAAPSAMAPSYSAGRSAVTTPASTARLGITVPAGTLITVRMIDPVDSSVNQMGETFRASLDEPLVVNGRTVANRGSEVTAKLTEVEQSGRLTGRSELRLVLLDMMVDGRRYEVTTSEVAEAGSSRGASTAKRVGGTAAVGAVIGGIFGGGKGAAQGAAAGAGAATAVQVLTKGEQVKIPAESRLEFTLANPLYL